MLDRHTLETPQLLGSRLRLVFLQKADRYLHLVQWNQSGEVVEVLQSVEGTPDERWPASPALQHLHIEERDSHRVGLLVGMAGRSHWSMSVEPDPARAGFLFDVACRVAPSESPELQSTYAGTGRGQLGGTEYRMSLADGLVLAVMAAEAGTTLHCSEAGALRIVPSSCSGATWRWKYRVELLRF